MDDGATNTSAGAADSSSSRVQHEDRGVWVLTAYAISGLALLGVLIYYFSTYITQ